MTRRARAHSATISEGGALSGYGENGACALITDRATNIPARASRSFGRFCAVHLWPDLKCPPRYGDVRTWSIPLRRTKCLKSRDELRAVVADQPGRVVAPFWLKRPVRSSRLLDRASSLDDLVRAQQHGLWNREADRLGRDE